MKQRGEGAGAREKSGKGQVTEMVYLGVWTIDANCSSQMKAYLTSVSKNQGMSALPDSGFTGEGLVGSTRWEEFQVKVTGHDGIRLERKQHTPCRVRFGGGCAETFQTWTMYVGPSQITVGVVKGALPFLFGLGAWSTFDVWMNSQGVTHIGDEQVGGVEGTTPFLDLTKVSVLLKDKQEWSKEAGRPGVAEAKVAWEDEEDCSWGDWGGRDEEPQEPERGEPEPFQFGDQETSTREGSSLDLASAPAGKIQDQLESIVEAYLAQPLVRGQWSISTPEKDLENEAEELNQKTAFKPHPVDIDAQWRCPGRHRSFKAKLIVEKSDGHRELETKLARRKQIMKMTNFYGNETSDEEDDEEDLEINDGDDLHEQSLARKLSEKDCIEPHGIGSDKFEHPSKPALDKGRGKGQDGGRAGQRAGPKGSVPASLCSIPGKEPSVSVVEHIGQNQNWTRLSP